MKELREMNGYKIVCDDNDDIAIDNHTWLANYCIDRSVCEGCGNYKAISNNEMWLCEKNEDIVQSCIGVIVGRKYRNAGLLNRKTLHNGMPIPENCVRKFEHTILTQEMDAIKQ